MLSWEVPFKINELWGNIVERDLLLRLSTLIFDDCGKKSFKL